MPPTRARASSEPSKTPRRSPRCATCNTPSRVSMASTDGPRSKRRSPPRSKTRIPEAGAARHRTLRRHGRRTPRRVSHRHARGNGADYRYTWHRRSWSAFRSYVQLDLGKRPTGPDDDVEITLDEARHLIAREHGFSNWQDLTTFSNGFGGQGASRGQARASREPPTRPSDSRTVASSRDWDEIIRLLGMHPSATLQAEGQMTDAILADIAKMPGAEHVTALDLNGSKMLTDDGMRHLARFSSPPASRLGRHGAHRPRSRGARRSTVAQVDRAMVDPHNR